MSEPTWSFPVRLLTFTFGCAFLTYLFPLTHFTLNVDGESERNFEHTVSLGRWSHALLRLFVLPEPFVPTFTLALGLLAFSAAAVLACRIVPFTGFAAMTFCASFVSFPQMAYQFQFLNQADTIGIGYMLAVASFYVLDRQGDQRPGWQHLHAPVAILMLSAATSIYQTLALVPLTLLGGTLAIRHSRRPFPLTAVAAAFVRTGLITGLALVSSFLIGRIFIRAIGRSNDDYLLQTAFDPSRMIEEIPENVRLLMELLGGRGHPGFALYVGATAAGVLFAMNLMRQDGRRALPAVAAMLLTLLIPVCIVFAGSDGLPARTYVAMNSAFAISLAAFAPLTGPLVSSLATLLVVLIGFGTVSTFFVSDHLVRQADIRIGTRVVQDIAERHPDSPTSVYFYGAIEPHRSVHTARYDTFGTSFWSWDGGNTQRIVPFLSFYDIAQFTVASEEMIRQVDAEAKEMPIWPRPGSIRVIGDIVVVRLGEERGYLPFELVR